MATVTVGPRANEQLQRFGREWRQGEHVLITGPTGSGKTTLARHVVQRRLDRGGHVVVFVGKLGQDKTITSEYAGWERWKTWQRRRPSEWQSRILLWPDTSRMSIPQARAHQRLVFADAMDRLSRTGKWTVQIDEGLYTCDPSMLNLSGPLGMLSNMGRSANLTTVVLAQRPANLPLVLYSNASHVFAGRARELSDQKRLSELGGRESSKELIRSLSQLGRRDFMWIPVAPDWPSEPVNLRT